MRKGDLVETQTAKIGQATRVGRVIDLHDEFVVVEWEDGHVSTITRTSVRPIHHGSHFETVSGS